MTHVRLSRPGIRRATPLPSVRRSSRFSRGWPGDFLRGGSPPDVGAGSCSLCSLLPGSSPSSPRPFTAISSSRLRASSCSARRSPFACGQNRFLNKRTPRTCGPAPTPPPVSERTPAMRKLFATTAMVAALAGGMTATLLQPATAQVTVIDPIAIAQAVKQVSQQLQQIAQLEAQLNNEAAMLRSLGTNVTGPLLTINAQATQLLQQAQGIGYNSQNVAQQYSQVYPANMEGMSFAQIIQALASWQTNSRQTLQQAMATQNQIVQSQTVTANAVNGAVAASQGAAGQTGAIQATNQLLAALSTQLTQLQTILITQARATQTAEAQAQAAQAAGAAESQRYWTIQQPASRVTNPSSL